MTEAHASRFYVYVIFRTNGLPCYVGKGTGRRWQRHFTMACQNAHLRALVVQGGGSLPVVIIRERLTSEEATAAEIALIAAIGRESSGGVLINQTDGGDGNHGFPPEVRARLGFRGKHTEETKKRIAAANRGKKRSREFCERIRQCATGRVMSDEAREKMRAAAKARGNSNRKPILGTRPLTLAERARRYREKARASNPEYLVEQAKKRREYRASAKSKGKGSTR